MAGTAGRKRMKNFSIDEKQLLSELLKDYHDILSSAFTNEITNRKKAETWKSIQLEVNALGVAFRSVEQLREKARKMKERLKRCTTAWRVMFWKQVAGLQKNRASNWTNNWPGWQSSHYLKSHIQFWVTWARHWVVQCRNTLLHDKSSSNYLNCEKTESLGSNWYRSWASR